jgi:microcystin-dependent protein
MDFLRTSDTVSQPIGANSTGGAVIRSGLLTDGTTPLNASKNFAKYYNMLLEEMYYVITQAGIAPDANNWHQLYGAVSAIVSRQVNALKDEISLPVGAILAFPTTTAPAGWLIADGSQILRSDFVKLFDAIGTIYGAGDGVSTFNLPDHRGVVGRGLDRGRGLDIGRQLGSYQADELKSHTHRFGAFFTGSGNESNGGYVDASGAQNNAVTLATGGSETRVKSIALNYCIKY